MLLAESDQASPVHASQSRFIMGKILNSINHQIRTTPWLGRLALRSIPDLQWQVNVHPIGDMAIRLRQNRSFWLRDALIHEGFMLGALQRLIRPGDVVFDVGANIGLYSRFMIQEFKASLVYAFEPMETNRRLISRNLALGCCEDRVTVVSFAVGDQDGDAPFQVDDVSSASGTLDAVTHGAASQARRQYGLSPRTTTVKACRLDTLISRDHFPVPRVVKIDVEGAEAIALRGALELLRKYQPRLVIELHGAVVTKEVLQALWRCSYHCFGYLQNNGRSVYQEVTSADLPFVTDIYSLHHLMAAVEADDLVAPVEHYSPPAVRH